MKTETLLLNLLVVAFVFSLATTLLNFTDLGPSLTGAITATGDTNLTIESNTAITNQIADINFGSGYVDAACSSCVMDSNGQSNQTGACCIGFINVTSGFLLENTGNTNLSVNFTCSGNCTAAQFVGVGGTFEIKVTNNFVAGQSGETGSADTIPSCANTYNSVAYGGWNYTQSPGQDLSTPEGEYQDMDSGTAFWICGNSTHFPLNSTAASDAAVVDINVSIPDSISPTGIRASATFTFNAISDS